MTPLGDTPSSKLERIGDLDDDELQRRMTAKLLGSACNAPAVGKRKPHRLPSTKLSKAALAAELTIHEEKSS